MKRMIDREIPGSGRRSLVGGVNTSQVVDILDKSNLILVKSVKSNLVLVEPRGSGE